MANSTFQERSIMRKIILALLFSLVVTPVFGKVVTMNGVQYQVWIDEESGEYRMKPVDSSLKDFGKPKVTKLQPIGSLLNPPKKEKVISKRSNKIEPLGSVLNGNLVKSDIVEKTKTEVIYTEEVCDDPMGCPQDTKTGECPDCKKITVYEEKVVQKVPSEEKIEHTILRENEIFDIKEGKYSLIKVQTIVGSDMSIAYVKRGLTLDILKLSRGEFYFSLYGGAEYFIEGHKYVFSCPKEDKWIIEFDNEGELVNFNHVKYGSCKTKEGISTRFRFKDNILTRIRVSPVKVCDVGCNGRSDLYRTDIHTYEYSG